MITFWWVRHGPTHAKGLVGWTDLPADLSDRGKLEKLSGVLPQDALVISSDLSRAVATADAIQGPRPRLPHDVRLREMNFGKWENLHYQEIEKTDPETVRAFFEQPGDTSPPGGESWNDVSARVQSAVDDLAKAHAGCNIVVIAHFAVILTQVQRALNVPPKDALAHQIDNLSVTRISIGDQVEIGPINFLPWEPR